MKTFNNSRLAKLIVFALLNVFLFGTILPAEAASKKLDVLRTYARKDCSLAPYLIAQKKGFLEKEGIKFLFTGQVSAEQAIPALLAGQIDLDDAHPNTVAIIRAGGAKIKGVAANEIDPPLTANPYLRHMFWYVKNDSPIKNFGDIKKLDRKVKISTVARNICSDYLATKLLEKYNVPKDKVEFVVMPDIQAIQAVKQGLIDIAGVHPPFYKANDKNGNRRIATSSDAVPGANAGTTVFFFSEKFIKKNPDVVKRFVKGMKNAQRWINSHRNETNRLVEKEIGIPINANHYYNPSGRIIDTNIQEWVDGAIKMGALKKGQVKISDFITHDFEKYGDAPKKN